MATKGVRYTPPLTEVAAETERDNGGSTVKLGASRGDLRVVVFVMGGMVAIEPMT